MIALLIFYEIEDIGRDLLHSLDELVLTWVSALEPRDKMLEIDMALIGRRKFPISSRDRYWECSAGYR
jgi:hypothetical protein